MLKLLHLFLLISIYASATGQSNVAITIDDVPNTVKYKNNNFKSKLLSKLDSLNTPIALFINEGRIYKEYPNETQNSSINGHKENILPSVTTHLVIRGTALIKSEPAMKEIYDRYTEISSRNKK